MGPNGPHLSSCTLSTWFIRVGLALGSVLQLRAFLVIIEGCIEVSEQGL